MDEYIYSEHWIESEKGKIIEEKESETFYLQVLNFSQLLPDLDPPEIRALKPGEDFDNFITRKEPSVFAPPAITLGNEFTNGIRLVLHPDAKKANTFSPHVISFDKDDYQSLVEEMRLPIRAIETSSVLGPFFWWRLDTTSPDPQLEMVFRKSDVVWKGVSRGWEMMLSYSFRTRITSGYLKAAGHKFIQDVLKRLIACSQPASHPLLLPILVLGAEISAKNDKDQRKSRERARRLEDNLVNRYKNKDTGAFEPKLQVPTDLDVANCELADWHCETLWKRPQAWRNAAARLAKAMDAYWDQLPKSEKTPDLQKLHGTLQDRLDFVNIKLEGLEHYADVTVERFNIQREVINNFMAQRESRLAIEIAVQQILLAKASKRDSTSMKTLAVLGSLFLPGAFLSSLFSMTFFDFDPAAGSTVSSMVWLYFAIMASMTIAVLGGWWIIDWRSNREYAEDLKEAKRHIGKLEHQIVEDMNEKTGARIKTLKMTPA